MSSFAKRHQAGITWDERLVKDGHFFKEKLCLNDNS